MSKNTEISDFPKISELSHGAVLLLQCFTITKHTVWRMWTSPLGCYETLCLWLESSAEWHTLYWYLFGSNLAWKSLQCQKFEVNRGHLDICAPYSFEMRPAPCSSSESKTLDFSSKVFTSNGHAVWYHFCFHRAISRNAGIAPESLKEYVDETPNVPLEHPKELKLAKKLIQFHEVLLSVLDTLFMHQLCDYLYELSGVFTEFYDNCYCIEKERETGKLTEWAQFSCDFRSPFTGKILRIHMHRLLLCEATAGIMNRCFQILGIQPIGKMWQRSFYDLFVAFFYICFDAYDDSSIQT